MERNPYSPPASVPLETAPSEGGPRPFAVWLFLVFLSVFTLACIGVLAQFIWIALHSFGVRNPQLLVEILASRLACIAVGSFAVISAYRRWRWGRWLGLVAIAGVAIWFILRPLPSDYPDFSYAVGFLSGKYVFSPLLCAWWAYEFGFSPKAKRYFR